MTTKLLTIDEFCDAYRIGRSSFYSEVNAGNLQIVKIMDKTLVREQDAEAWLETKLTTSLPERKARNPWGRSGRPAELIDPDFDGN